MAAIAYDNAGNAGISPAMTFSVNNVVADTTAPSVSVSISGSSGTVTLSATASDNVGVSRVDFLVDNVVMGSDTSSPYSLAGDSNMIANGDHQLTARATDAAGNVGTSSTVNFTVNNVTTVTPDNSTIVAAMNTRLANMTATLASMSQRNSKVQSLQADVAAQKTLVSQIK